jgi:fibronectin-binding autotransporter adhesin
MKCLRRQSPLGLFFAHCLEAMALLSVFIIAGASQTLGATVTYTIQDAYYTQQFNSGGDFFNNGGTELGMWANSGNKQTVGWRNFKTEGTGGGSDRSLQVGDIFKISVSATRAFGQIGFSLNAGGTQGSSYDNRTSGSRLYFNTDNYGAWYVNRSGGNTTLGSGFNPIQNTFKDYIFTIRITSETTADTFMTVDGVDYRAYNLQMNGSAGSNISAFSIYGSDMWDGDSNENAYWKQDTSVQDTGRVELGYYLGSTSTFNPGLVKDGLAANSTVTSSANSVFVGGDSGSAVIMDDSNTYTGGTTVNSNATVRLAHNNALSTNGAVTVTSGGRIQMSNGITVSRSLVLNGDGLNYSGSLQNVSGNNTWSGNITNNSGARINSDSGTLTISGNITNAANQTLYIGGAGNTTVDGTITGNVNTAGWNGALYKDGSGTLVLSANNTGLTGTVQLRGGTLSVTNGNSLGTGALQLGSGNTLTTLLVNSNTTIANRLEVLNSASNAVINVASGTTTTMSGVVSQTNGMVNTTKFGKDGAGTLVFNNSGGTYNGQIQIGQGSVVMGATGALGTNTSTSARGVDLGLNVGDTSTANNVSLLASNGVTVAQSIYVAPNTSGGTRTIGITGGGTNTFNNEIFLGGDLTIDGGSSATDRVNLDGAIVNTSGIIKSNAGTAVLSGNNTYTGATTVSGGTLRLGAANRISDSSAVSVSSGATFDLNGNNETVGSIAGAGNVTLSAGQLTAGQNNSATSFSGVMSGSGGAFTKLGTGTTTFSGSSANTYSGITTINAGILTLAKTAGVNAIAGNVTIGDSSGSDELGLGASDQIADTSVITLNGTVANQRGVFRLYGFNETIGGLSGDGLVEFGLTGTGASVLTVNVSSGTNSYNGTMRNTGAANAATLGFVKTGSGTQILTGANTYTGGTLVSAGVLEGIGGSSLQGDITNNATVNFNQTTTNTYSGNMSGTGVLNKLGTGSVILSGSNSYSGGTTLSAGTLNLNSARALGTGAFTLSNGVTFANTSGSAITNANNNAITLNGTNTFSSGTLNMGTGAVTIGSATRLTVSTGDLTLGGNVSGSAAFNKDGGGTLRLSGSNSFSSYTVVDYGTLELANVDALRNANLYVYGTSASKQVTFGLAGNNTYNIEQISAGTGGSLAIGGNTLSVGANGGNSTFSGSISGTGGGVTKVGTGTLTLSGSNSYTGTSTVNKGVLAISSGASLGSSSVVINSNAVLRATANLTNAQNITVSTGQTGFVEASAGTTNTLNGTLSKNGSVLVLGGGGTHIVNGSITGANANSDLYVSNSTTTINSSNSYNGPTFIVAGGTLNNGTNNALPTDTALTLGQTGEISTTTNRYNLNGYSQTVASVATAGSSAAIITNSTGTGNLTLNSSSAKSISNLTMGGSGLTLTKSGANTVTLASGNSIAPGTIAIQQGTLLLGAANQIGDNTTITLSGGTLNTAGYADAVGKLTVSANSTIQGLNSTSGSAFTFSDIDLADYSTSSGSTLTFLNSGGTSYGLGTVIQLSTVAASSWSGYSATSLNNFSSKISFSDANLMAQINFGGGTSGTTLTVAAIPEPRVYAAAAGLVLLIGWAEFKRRRGKKLGVSR